MWNIGSFLVTEGGKGKAGINDGNYWWKCLSSPLETAPYLPLDWCGRQKRKEEKLRKKKRVCKVIAKTRFPWQKMTTSASTIYTRIEYTNTFARRTQLFSLLLMVRSNTTRDTQPSALWCGVGYVYFLFRLLLESPVFSLSKKIFVVLLWHNSLCSGVYLHGRSFTLVRPRDATVEYEYAPMVLSTVRV